jgi:PAS domain S-box-containing protein
MAFDARAMENIATAPASPADRLTAGWISAAILACFAAVLPLSDLRLATAAAFVPAILSAAVVAQLLTALLLYVQYRIARQSKLALLSLAYASSAVLIACYMLTFPGAFSATGLFGATLQTAAWFAIFERETFILLLIAFACADRYGWNLDRRTVRWLAAAVLLWVAAAAYAAVVVPLPLVLVDGHATDLWYRVVVPFSVLSALSAIVLLATGGLRTVTQVWMIVVGLIYCCETIANALFSGGRYTLGWYTGRSAMLAGACVLLAVFIVKINDLMVRLTRRNRALTERTELAELEAAEGELRYRSLANVVPQLIWTADAAGEVDFVNDRWIGFTGLDVRETRSAGWFSVLADVGRVVTRVAWAESLRLGRPFRGEHRLREAASGRLRWFLVDVIPMHDESGAIVRWIGASTDIDRSKRSEEREAFLAAAGDRLSASLDVNATLATISGAIIGPMATWARVDLLDEDGRFATATANAADVSDDERLRRLIGQRIDARLEALFGAAIQRRDVVVEHDVAVLAAATGVTGTYALLVPLIGGNAPLGVLTLVSETRAEPDENDLAMAREFGRRAAQALDHARRYEGERTTADSFQRAMLPHALPLIENVSFSAGYSAASETRRVGGDFYDAFELADGRVALTIGDVTGHGLEAAVIMGEIRQSLRAAASFDDTAPSSILDRASRLLVGSGRSIFVTAIFGVLDPRTGLFEYATAGHPAPIVFDGSIPLRLAGSGLPIGLREDEGVDFALNLPSPCTIVLYTDGLIEFARDLDDGERRLDDAIVAVSTEANADIADALMLRVLGTDQATDDIAILTATIHSLPDPPHEPLRRWRFASSDQRTGVIVRHEIGALVAAWTGDAERRYDGELAFGEIYSNVVRHAPGAVEVVLRETARGAELCVIDRGEGFRRPVAPTDAFAESGRGLHLVRAVADDVEIAAEVGCGTRVTVLFERPVAAGRDGRRSTVTLPKLRP